MTKSLDHPIRAADKEQIPLLVLKNQIPREHHSLAVGSFSGPERVWPKHSVRSLRVTPVPEGHCRPTMNQLADLARPTRSKIFAKDEDLSTWYRLPNRVRFP